MATSYQLLDDIIWIELFQNQLDDPENDYVAMALSEDNVMGNDLVFVCSHSSQWKNENVQVFWNELWKTSVHIGYLSEAQFSVEVTMQDGKLKCVWKVGQRFSNQPVTPSQISDGQYYPDRTIDFLDDHFLLLASGQIGPTKNKTHRNLRSITKHTTKLASKDSFRIDPGKKNRKTILNDYNYFTL